MEDSSQNAIVSSLLSKVIPFLGLMARRLDIVKNLPFWQFVLIFLLVDSYILYILHSELRSLSDEYSNNKFVNLLISVFLHIVISSSYLDIIIKTSYLISLTAVTLSGVIFFLQIYHNNLLLHRSKLSLTIIIIFIWIIVISATSAPIRYPIVHKNQVEFNFFPEFLYMPELGKMEEISLHIDIIEGQIWKVNVSIENSGEFDAYIDERINGTYLIPHMRYNQSRSIPLQIYSPHYMKPGLFYVTYKVEYQNYLQITSSKLLQYPVYVVDPPSPESEFPIVYVAVGLVVIAAAAYFYMQSQLE